jgi:hypothetical protein
MKNKGEQSVFAIREAELSEKPLSQLIKYSNDRIPWFKLKGKYQR